MINRSAIFRIANSRIATAIHAAPANAIQSGKRFNILSLRVLDTSRPVPWNDRTKNPRSSA